ncbi:MAG: threonine-phosphate decarboxylase [Halioglobus sp.]|nr:threonine-phosphate decarboxylase [Halioglobus sp.]
MTLEHGGNIAAAASRFNIPAAHWIDLSTGISPWIWPVPAVPQQVWQQLPYPDGQLELAAAAYYGCQREALVAVPGSQYALQYTPALLPAGAVAIPQRGYAEHRVAWRSAGHRIVEYADSAALRGLVEAGSVDHALVINPNNPTAEIIPARQLQDLHMQLQQRGGWLVVDEAFADICAAHSLAATCPQPGLVVYRSLGKFFGLAGVRLGFMLAPQPLCQRMQALMPPWSLSHPARWVGEVALRDRHWQSGQLLRLQQASAQWLQLLRDCVPRLRFVATALFVTGQGEANYCQALYQAMGRRAVLLRVFEAIGGSGLLRFGLPLPADRDLIAQLIREAVEECECIGN